MFHPGDYVYPADLPGRFLCRVAAAEDFDVPAGRSQILKLEPLEGPWPEGTLLIRLDKAVEGAPPRRRVSTRAHIPRVAGGRRHGVDHHGAAA
jgi:hypothetical protein